MRIGVDGGEGYSEEVELVQPLGGGANREERRKNPEERVLVARAQLERREARIVGELNGVQGKPVDVGGYYQPDPELTARAMRPSSTLNAIIDACAVESSAPARA